MRDGSAARAHTMPIREEAPDRAEFRADVIDGVSKRRRTLQCKYLYDEAGAELFERICELEAYYPTRTEWSILQCHAGEMARLIGPGARVVEFGSGSAVKTELLLQGAG